MLFRNRSWLPVPFVAVLLLAPGHSTLAGSLIGIGLLALGEGWRLWAVAAAGTVTRRRSRRVQTLISHGPFALHRNPLYAGNFVIWLGVVTGSGALWFLPVAAVLFALEYYFIIRYEEGVLESFFGAEYLAYKARTPRWLIRGAASPVRGELHWGEAWKSERSTFLQYAALVAVFVAKHVWLDPR